MNFVRVFSADFSLKSREKKGGTLHSFDYYYYYYYYSTTTTTNARGRVVRALRERGDDCTRGISGQSGTDVREDCI